MPLTEPQRARVEALLDGQPWSVLREPLLSVASDVDAVTARIHRFATMVVIWNRSVSNLISRNDEVRIVDRHIFESIAPARFLSESGAKRWVDFGSGAGFPAIPLALAGVGDHWTLVESRRPKVLFMKKTIQDLELSGIDVVHARLEALLEEESPGPFDGFTSRATLALGPTLVLASRVVVLGGVAFLWKGSRRQEEMAEDRRWTEFWSHEGDHPLGEGRGVVSRFLRIK